MSFVRLEYTTLDQEATQKAVKLLQRADLYDRLGKPKKWGNDLRRRSLRHLEHSFWLRNWSVDRTLPPIGIRCAWSSKH